MFAYLVCVTGIVTGLVMSFVVFFATPAQQSAVSGYAIAVLAKPSATQTARASAEKPTATIEQRDEHVASGAAKAEAVPPMTIAIDARQKPLFSPKPLSAVGGEGTRQTFGLSRALEL